MQGGISGKIQRECCFTNWRTSCKDNQVRILPSISYPVKACEPGGDSGNVLILVTEIFNSLDGFYQYPVNGIKIFPEVIVRNLE